jgi:hypothetical protein
MTRSEPGGDISLDKKRVVGYLIMSGDVRRDTIG